MRQESLELSWPGKIGAAVYAFALFVVDAAYLVALLIYVSVVQGFRDRKQRRERGKKGSPASPFPSLGMGNRPTPCDGGCKKI